MKRYLGSKGFGLVEVMLAAAMAGGLALTIAKLSQDSNRVTKSTETNMEINNFVTDVSYILSDKDNCNATVIPGSTIGTPITSINRDGSATPAYELAPKKYGNNTFSIQSMTTESTPNGLSFVMNIKRENKTTLSSQNIIRRIPLEAVVTGSTINSCFSDTDNIIKQAVEQSCNGPGARYDSATNECHHDFENVINCSVGQFIRGHISNNGRMENVCENIFPSDTACPAGSYVKSVSATGTVTCEPLTASNPAGCATNQYAVQLSNGALVCRAFPTCPGRQLFVTGADGVPKCLNVPCNTMNQYIAGLDAGGNAVCKNFPNRDCGPGKYVKAIDLNGNIACDDVPPNVGIPRSDFSFVDGWDTGTGSWSRKDINQIAEQICLRFANHTWTGTQCLGPGGDYITKTELAAIKPPAEQHIHRTWIQPGASINTQDASLVNVGRDITSSADHIVICGTSTKYASLILPAAPYNKRVRVTFIGGVQKDDRDSSDHVEIRLGYSQPRNSSMTWIDLKAVFLWGSDWGESWDTDTLVLDGFVNVASGVEVEFAAYGRTESGGCARYQRKGQFLVEEIF